MPLTSTQPNRARIDNTFVPKRSSRGTGLGTRLAAACRRQDDPPAAASREKRGAGATEQDQPPRRWSPKRDRPMTAAGLAGHQRRTRTARTGDPERGAVGAIGTVDCLVPRLAGAALPGCDAAFSAGPWLLANQMTPIASAPSRSSTWSRATSPYHRAQAAAFDGQQKRIDVSRAPQMISLDQAQHGRWSRTSAATIRRSTSTPACSREHDVARGGERSTTLTSDHDDEARPRSLSAVGDDFEGPFRTLRWPRGPRRAMEQCRRRRTNELPPSQQTTPIKAGQQTSKAA